MVSVTFTLKVSVFTRAQFLAPFFEFLYRKHFPMNYVLVYYGNAFMLKILTTCIPGKIGLRIHVSELTILNTRVGLGLFGQLDSVFNL